MQIIHTSLQSDNHASITFISGYYYYNHFTALDFVRDNPGEPIPEGTFRYLLDFLMQNEDNTGRHTNNPDGLPSHAD